MTSTTTPWTAGAPSGRWRHRAAVTAVTFAVAVAGGAVASASGALSWTPTGPGAHGPAGSPGGVPLAPTGPDETDAEDRLPEPSDPAVEEPSPDEPSPEEPSPDEPSPDEPSTDEPSTDEPSDDEPSGDEPSDVVVVDRTTGDEDRVTDGTDVAPALATAEVQRRLRDARFLIGPADGEPGQQTTAAIMAFQRVNGLGVDGVVGPATTAALLEGSAEPVLAGGPADRIEVDLDRQLLHLVEAGQRIVTMQVSSGNGETYTSGNGTARARTPIGSFVIERRIHGIRQAALGTLYDPLYFHRGFAIHGSPSVPAYPASHGCVRIAMADAAWLIQRVPDGTPVHLYGGTHVFTP